MFIIELSARGASPQNRSNKQQAIIQIDTS
jgi:hypothetical protein